jgi:hypothetical protein
MLHRQRQNIGYLLIRHFSGFQLPGAFASARFRGLFFPPPGPAFSGNKGAMSLNRKLLNYGTKRAGEELKSG